MTETIQSMKQRLAEQEAWGKWNTAPLANRIAAAEREAMSPSRHLLHDMAGGAFEATMLVAGWAFTLAPFVAMVKSWIG
ncbi:hypothetical protein RDJLphi1_gp10 [Roseobacter phage RDJL Phi 1]|uniref:Uncharacterized protein n=1 Tax=Roseobacter phage RDJL Phi 1 TaxID=562742 RepID=F4YXM1_9CAUD|nr:hypothetical protein RDJLphi1_gp10 [Roseobacter phage RDJL Phi 1]ADK73411.1 hypothetical protein RDJLphi1_gp10 [Roseobacter phage RDJL Phi 1]